MKRTLSILSLLILSSCSFIPRYEQPDFPAAHQWQEVPDHPEQSGDRQAAQVAWQSYFASEALQFVINTALEHNRDLKQAALNIAESRAVYRISQADLKPEILAAGAASYTRASDDTAVSGEPNRTDLYEARLGLASYEIDFFGRIRSRNESALNAYLATEQARQVVRTTLIADTANAYLQLLADEKLLELTRQTLKAQEEIYQILSKSLEKGASTKQDVERAGTAVQTAQVNFHRYSRYVAQDKNALGLIMGVSQDRLPSAGTTLDNIIIDNSLTPGLPSEVLLQRPDVKEAGFELLARNADIGIARAAFFPSITLTGTYGFASDTLVNLFTAGGAGAWSFLPQITLPIFRGGRNQANLEVAEIRKDKAVLRYEKTIRNAFREVADALAAKATLTSQLTAQHQLVETAQNVYDLSEARYHAGIDNFLSVLDAERELYNAQQTEILLQREGLANIVNLYKALGGGQLLPDDQPIRG